MAFADTKALEKEGRSFNCNTCPEAVKKIRRCKEDREDFTGADGPIWPMAVQKGGETYGFCPAKSAWDPAVKERLDFLIVIAETGWKPYAGGLMDQPAWVVEELGWFLPKYDFMKFMKKAELVLGGGGDKKVKSNTSIGTQKKR